MINRGPSDDPVRDENGITVAVKWATSVSVSTDPRCCLSNDEARKNGGKSSGARGPPKRIPASAPIRESEASYSLPSQRHRPMPPSFRPPAGDRHGVASTMSLTHRPRAFGSPLITKGAQDPTRGSGRLPADRDSLFRRAFRPLSALYFRPIKDEGHPRSKGRKPATSWRSRSVTQANSRICLHR